MTDWNAQSSATDRVHHLVGHLFRHKAGEIISTLVRIFGIERLELVEDVVQDSLIAALKNWTFKGIPDNPEGWIVTAARNRAIDLIRREKSLAARESEIVSQLYERLTDNNAFQQSNSRWGAVRGGSPDGIADDQLAMMFACCHPDISPESQVALTLKLLAGFSVTEIARAFLTAQTVIAQRIIRAKRQLKQHRAAFKIPEGNDLTLRIRAVTQVLYLMFNEGYNAGAGEDLIRFDLVNESIRLTGLLAGHRCGESPEVFALLALLCLQAARLPARVDREGNLVLLDKQDRALWDKKLISRGMHFLDKAAAGDQLTAYHLEAGVAACHASAASYDQTDWTQILLYYDQLVALNSSPILALNRAVAVAMTHSPETALGDLEPLADDKRLSSYYLYHATRADLLVRLNRHGEALDAYRAARELTSSEPERRFLSGKIESLSEREQ